MRTKLLLIDDDKEFLSELGEVLAWEGFEVETSADDKDVVCKACEFKPDVILLDLNMRYISGFEISNSLKNTDGTKDIPIVAMSGYYKPADHWFVSFSNFSLWLKKNSSVADIVSELKFAMGRPNEQEHACPL